MQTSEQIDSVPSVVKEFLGAPLGHGSRNKRLEAIVARCSAAPSKSVPDILADDDAELEGFYRFVNNPKVVYSDVMEPHILQTCERIARVDEVIVAHDTTELEFSGEVHREGLGFLRGKDQGYLLHTSLAIAGDGTLRPLGIVAAAPWVRTGPKRSKKNGKKRSGGDYANDPDRESLRWGEQIQEVNLRVGDPRRVIHVFDREADIYTLLCQMTQAEVRFVGRSARDRVVGAELAVGATDRLSAVLTCAPTLAEREVPLSRRRESKVPGLRKTFPPREARAAKLAVRALPVVLHRPNYLHDPWPPTLVVNVVHVTEIDPPEGMEPVEWTLFTQEPIDTAEQVLRVVDWYRARWLVEEFFRALKVGCAVEKRQNETYEALLNVLAIFVPIAWKLLVLRSLARTEPEAPATTVLTETQIEVLRSVARRPLEPCPTVTAALNAVAGLGGHIKNNGNPGWQIIGRGLERLLTLEIGWVAALQAQRRGSARRVNAPRRRPKK
jgi:hypothetical protein